LVGPHISIDPGLEGINEFETNTLQMQIWVSIPTLLGENQTSLTLFAENQIDPASSVGNPTTLTLSIEY